MDRFFVPQVILILIFSLNDTCALATTFNSYSNKPNGLSPLQKQKAKEQSRWTFQDWLDTKKVIANQNMWLAGNRSKPVSHEFYISYEQASLERKTSVSGTTSLTQAMVSRSAFGAFTSFVGLSGEYFDFTDNQYGWNATFNLRILGNSIQNTHFTLLYGGRTRIDHSGAQEVFKNQFYGVSLALYIFRQLGIEGVYQNFLPEKSDRGNLLSGNQIEGTFFVDYGILRAQGTWFKEYLEITDPSLTLTQKTSVGVLAGIKFYF